MRHAALRGSVVSMARVPPRRRPRSYGSQRTLKLAIIGPLPLAITPPRFEPTGFVVLIQVADPSATLDLACFASGSQARRASEGRVDCSAVDGGEWLALHAAQMSSARAAVSDLSRTCVDIREPVGKRSVSRVRDQKAAARLIRIAPTHFAASDGGPAPTADHRAIRAWPRNGRPRSVRRLRAGPADSLRSAELVGAICE